MVQMKYLVPPELYLSSNKLAVQKEQEKAENDCGQFSGQHLYGMC